MKRFVLAIALTGLMSITVLAGDIPTNDAPAPLPPPTTSSTTSTSSALLVTLILIGLGLR